MTMTQITPTEFLNKIESGNIEVVCAVGRRLYGRDKSYDLATWASGKSYRVVWADIP